MKCCIIGVNPTESNPLDLSSALFKAYFRLSKDAVVYIVETLKDDFKQLRWTHIERRCFIWEQNITTLTLVDAYTTQKEKYTKT
ncbi:uncharacterized protein isoform X2 [Musca autumnalis]|uniref:uncharacterized protein isoform X2 n=1 Tax=Musca autumnalis TaxID=221902 RepID=UPI003CEA2026